MLETVLQPLTSYRGSSEIQTVTPRLQTLGLMKPTSVIPKNEAKRKANVPRTCRMVPDIPSDFQEIVCQIQEPPFKTDLWHTCLEGQHDCKCPAPRKLLLQKFTLDVSSLLQEPEGLWMLCGTSCLQQWFEYGLHVYR